jgi:glycerol-3-phosphate dehydrogenase (NAD(P)+)
VAALTGPNLAKEVAQRMPAASVVACVDEGRGARLQDVFMAPSFRVYTNTDLIGCELGGALKNVMPSRRAWPRAWASATTRRSR